MKTNPAIQIVDQVENGEVWRLLLISAGGQAVGSCQIAGWNEAEPSIIGIIVEAPHQRRGYGTALIQKAIELAKAQGKSKLTLTVDKQNLPAIRLYQRLGFATDLTDSTQLWMSISIGG